MDWYGKGTSFLLPWNMSIQSSSSCMEIEEIVYIFSILFICLLLYFNLEKLISLLNNWFHFVTRLCSIFHIAFKLLSATRIISWWLNLGMLKVRKYIKYTSMHSWGPMWPQSGLSVLNRTVRSNQIQIKWTETLRYALLFTIFKLISRNFLGFIRHCLGFLPIKYLQWLSVCLQDRMHLN